MLLVCKSYHINSMCPYHRINKLHQLVPVECHYFGCLVLHCAVANAISTACAEVTGTLWKS